jgi:outer membrane protein OmpA-like peptidoglycan-associated protein/tetratricopeptide (TPR) repeat protein
MKKLFIPIILFIGISVNLSAQKKSDKDLKLVAQKSKKELKADKYFFRYAFDKAIDSYTHAKQLTLGGERNLAKSYSNLDQNAKAEEIYAQITNVSSVTLSIPKAIVPEDYYNYAMVLKSNSKYDQSDVWMEKFASVKPNDLRAKSYLSNKGGFSDIFNDKGKYQIHTLNVNSVADDYGTTYYKNKVVFASTKAFPRMIKRTYNWNGKPFWNIYASEVENGQLKNSEIFDKNFNSKFHDGPASFSNNGNFMAFTRNTKKDKTNDRIVELQIWFSSNKDGEWSKPEPFILNNAEYSVGQPFLTEDGNTMYFTSDMPGGYGGPDIYKATKDGNGSWGKAVNLGDKINTEGTEMYPFLEEKSGTLYFTSDGHYGLGGLDIFTSTLSGSEFGDVKNEGYPLNTQYDDFAAIVNDKLTTGYFSSNRANGSGGDDIYAFDITKAPAIIIKIQGIAMDKFSKPISNTTVALLNEKGDVIEMVSTIEDGAFTFTVDNDKNYKLVGKKEKYLDGNNVANTFGTELIVKADVILFQKEEVIAVVAEPKMYDLKTIFFDLDKFNVRPDAAKELDKMVKVMNDNPDMIVELGSHTDCRESVAYNQVLSDKRAKASTEYIRQRITNPSRITGKGYGKTKLVNGCACDDNLGANCTEEEHQENRRTEFVIIKKTNVKDLPMSVTK